MFRFRINSEVVNNFVVWQLPGRRCVPGRKTSEVLSWLIQAVQINIPRRLSQSSNSQQRYSAGPIYWFFFCFFFPP